MHLTHVNLPFCDIVDFSTLARPAHNINFIVGGSGGGAAVQ